MGEFVIAGSFVSYVLYATLDIHPLIAVPVAVVTFFLLGYLAYYLLMPRLYRSDDPETMSFLMMYGVSLMLAAIMLMLFEADTRALGFPLRSHLRPDRHNLRPDCASGGAGHQSGDRRAAGLVLVFHDLWQGAEGGNHEP